MSALDEALQVHHTRELLRFVTCGSVDDGKSTLIGRLLHDSRQLFADQLQALDADSRRHGTQGDAIDFALLVDGLEAEREQGITIDVAYRHLATPRRGFIVADCPGHEQYTRNMATGASTADAAVVLVDARKGLLTQSRRHSYILALLGVRQVILAVNKMDLVDWSCEVFETIASAYQDLAERLGIDAVHAVPLSALLGDNVVAPSAHMPWHDGPPLLSLLETLPIPRRAAAGFALPVQWVCRPDQDFRGYAGTLSGGPLQAGAPVVVLPSGRTSRIRDLLRAGRPADIAHDGDPVLVRLQDEVDAGRGDVLADPTDAPQIADQFRVQLVWFDASPMLPGRTYLLKAGTRLLDARITELRHRVDVNTQEHMAARALEANEVGVCHLHLAASIAFRPYAADRTLGSFILIDRQSHATAAAGTIDFALRRSGNLHWQALDIDKAMRAAALGQTPRCLWLTGLSGAGKSTLANLVERELQARGLHAYILDGDNIRHGLNKDLGFTDADRVENIRRVAEVARLMVDAGLIVLVSFISPFRAERRMARELFAPDEFLEIFVDAPLEVAEARDPKGLYAKARAGALRNFTGIDSPYEPPEAPELHLDAGGTDPQANVRRIIDRLLGTPPASD